MGKVIINMPELSEEATEQLVMELGNYLMRGHKFQIDWGKKKEDGTTKLLQENLGLGKTAKVTSRDSIFCVKVFYLPPKYLDSDEPISREDSKAWGSCLFKRDRNWGYFNDYETAEKCILDNWTDIYEQGYYNLAAVLEIPAGVCVMSKMTWFRVDPIYNEDEVKRREEWDKAWDEAVFFGKSLGKKMADYLRQSGVDLGSMELGALFGSMKYMAEKVGMDKDLLYKIQAGEAAPVFTEAQWDKLMTLVCKTPGDEIELSHLCDVALADPEGHGVPEIIRNRTIGWLITGYDIKKIDPPKRYKNIAFGLD